MKKNQMGFIPMGIAIAIVATALVTAGAGYGVYKYKNVSEEVSEPEEEISEQPEIVIIRTDEEDATDTESIDEEVVEKIEEVESVDTNITEPSTYIEPDTPTTYQAPVLNAPSVSTVDNSFTVRCNTSDPYDERASTKYSENMRLYIYEGNASGLNKNYDINWYSAAADVIGRADEKEVLLSFYDSGYVNVNVDVTRIDTGTTKIASCSVYVTCDDYFCLSEDGKKKWKLDLILDRIVSWKNSLFICYGDESVIRAYVYDYNLIKGNSPSAPDFDKDIDCGNSLDLDAYRYKIEQLKNSI